MMFPASSQLRRIAPWILVLAALANVRLLRHAVQYYRQPIPEAEDVAAFETHLRPLQDFLPAESVVGYLGAEEASVSDRAADFFLTRYALAPVRVVDDRETDLVVAHQCDPRTEARYLAANPGVTLVRDFGHGVKLYSRRTQDAALRRGPGPVLGTR